MDKAMEKVIKREKEKRKEKEELKLEGGVARQSRRQGSRPDDGKAMEKVIKVQGCRNCHGAAVGRLGCLHDYLFWMFSFLCLN